MHYHRALSMLLTAAAAMWTPLAAQGHTAHRHPSGAKIIMTGILVEPYCQFAQKLKGSGLQACVQRLSAGEFRPGLLDTSDSTFYVLHGLSAGDLGPRVRQLVGQAVKVDGTVFPAGKTYLIVVDSVRADTP